MSARHTLRQRHPHIAPRRLTRPYLTLARFTPSTWSPTLTLGRLPVPAQALTPRHLKRLYHPSVPRRTPVPTPQAIRSRSPNAFKPPTAHAVNVPTTSQYLTRSGPHPLLQTSTATRRTHRPPRILTFPTNNPPTPARPPIHTSSIQKRAPPARPRHFQLRRPVRQQTSTPAAPGRPYPFATTTPTGNLLKRGQSRTVSHETETDHPTPPQPSPYFLTIPSGVRSAPRGAPPTSPARSASSGHGG